MKILNKNIAIILGAGSGTRANLNIPKQFEFLGTQPVINWSINCFINSNLFEKIIVVLPKNYDKNLWTNIFGNKIIIIEGGNERDDSVNNALLAIKNEIYDFVFIHDAARPGLEVDILNNINSAFDDVCDGIIPVLSCNDAMWHCENEFLISPIDRAKLKRAQTPQAFRFDKYISARNSNKFNKNILDDAQIAIDCGLRIKHIEGSIKLDKITTKQDFLRMENLLLSDNLVSRNGIGFDAHRFCEGNEVVLCGVKIPHEFGLDGHSDADVAWHALVDAILGAIGEGDIGQIFPPNEAKWKGANSAIFLEYARDKVFEKGGFIENIDLTIICEAPKIGPYRDELKKSTAQLLRLDANNVNIKATTTEKMGFTGRKEGIAAMACATVLMKRGVRNVF